ncbi:hypothetical protein D477_002586 [Arthrobacter crystallopoietes BAB-32]|uniref:Uncharacterized protein n=1 Tax=Arthrobacter crystallopoietes BAB-32 TaxID=1246476 RepID=N1V738_9MICC|nr:DUF6507 family protein [Arthrobacter crystallopoietes]EMY35789.1 hypothetical protein D477_002586 [Arthrobacter crystallopoietes BAB-32]
MAADWDLDTGSLNSILTKVQTQAEKYTQLFEDFGAEVSSLIEASKSQIVGEALVGLSQEKLQAAMTQVQGRSVQALNSTSTAVNAIIAGDATMEQTVRAAQDQANDEFVPEPQPSTGTPRGPVPEAV